MSLAIHAALPPAAGESSDRPQRSDPQANGPTSTGVDTATISSAALNAAKVAIQEATETAAQTSKEANAGDHQAQRLLAKEQAAATKP